MKPQIKTANRPRQIRGKWSHSFERYCRLHGACDIIYLLFSYDLFTYGCYLLKIVYVLTIVAFSCSSRGSDCNRDASSVSFPRHSMYFYYIFIVYFLLYILSDKFIKLD